MLRDAFAVVALNAFQYMANIIGLNIYSGIPPGESNPSMPTPTFIYDFGPISPIAVDDDGKYNVKWIFPGDFKLEQTYSGGTQYAVAVDDKGAVKAYEYDAPSSTILINSGWGITITKEGSVIYHGPKNDSRGEICILVPYGYDLQGIELDSVLDVIESIPFDEAAWERNAAYDRQYFTIVFSDTVMIQEVNWDTNTGAPVVMTEYPNEHILRYTLKDFEPRWYQSTSEVDAVFQYAPTPVDSGLWRPETLLRTAAANLDGLKAKYAAETMAFDRFRNPAGLPTP